MKRRFIRPLTDERINLTAKGKINLINKICSFTLMKKVLVLVLSNLKHDARVRRQILALKDHYKTTVVSFGGDPSPDYELIVIKPTNLTLLRKAIASVFLLLKLYPTAHRILHNYITHFNLVGSKI